MSLRLSIIIISLSQIALLASSLDIYSDRSFYTYEPKESFIGFNTNLKAKNSEGSLELIRKNSCKTKSSLCTQYTHLQGLHVRLDRLKKEQNILDTIISQYAPDTNIDAQNTIKTASTIASRMAKIAQESQNLQKEIQNASALFSKHAPSKEPLFYADIPKSKVQLTINRGLYFHSEYLLDMDSSKLQHSLLLSNASGIDIEAEEVRLFAKPAGYISAPTQFYPRKIRIAQAQMKAKRAVRQDMMLMAAAPAPVAENSYHVKKLETRSYHLKNLILASDAKEKKLPLDSEKLTINTTLTWHPYNSNNVYKTASFTPKQTIESRQWKVRHKGQLIENAPIRKDGTKILLNVAIDYDIETKKETIHEFSQDKSIFSSARVKKEGFRLTLTNRSDKDKKVIITERIPLSIQEEIEVSLEKLDLPYKYDTKTGKLTITADIKGNTSKKMNVIYTITYPEKMKIYY